MEYKEAIILLDEPLSDDFGYNMAWSKSTGEIILKGKYGIYKLSKDWPEPFTPKEKDLNATDYEIIHSVMETILN